MQEKNTLAKKSFLDRSMDAVERAANKLPSPFMLFTTLFIITAVLSLVLSLTHVVAVHPNTGEEIVAQNFFTVDGMNWFLDNMVNNFIQFAPLGMVLTMTLGIGLCEEVGMVKTLIRRCMRGVPAGLVPYVIAFIGVNGSIASDSASVVIPPLAALAFIGVGRNPIAGMMVGFAGDNAGFGANLLLTGNDALMQGITNSVLDGFLGEGVFNVDVTCNYLFMIGSVFLLTFILGFVNNHIVEPHLPKIEVKEIEESEHLSDIERKGLRNTGFAALAYVALLAIGIATGILRNAETGSLATDSPFMNGLIPIMFGFFVVLALAYGFTTHYLKSEGDITAALTRQMAGMSGYVVFCFAAAQFIGLFSWTRLGTMLAIGGANLLKAIGFTGMPMIICFILIVAIVNVLTVSGSAKWSVFAPIFIPMFMMLGYHPAFIQLAYRIGDSCTNLISPMNAFLVMMLGLARTKYKKDATLGLFIANLLPYAIAVFICWSLFLIGWNLLGIPMGLGGEGMYLPAGIL